jgi:long-chain fatty acid transport protein
MKSLGISLSAALMMVFMMFCTVDTHATDGYLSTAYGTRAKGLAGAGLAYHHVSIIGGNPGANVFLGNQYSIGVAFFNPKREFTVTGNPSMMPGTFGLAPGTWESDNKLFVIPNIAGNWTIKGKNAFAVSMYGNGGMNTSYPTQVFHDNSYRSTGVDLSQMFAEATYSRVINKNHGVGVSFIGAFQWFEGVGFSTFGHYGMSADPANLSNNGYDHSFGYGFKVGYLGKVWEGLSVGASVQSPIFMTEFDKYAGLYADQGDFDIPLNWTIGLAYEWDDKFAFMADFKRIHYSMIGAVGNPMDPMALPPAFLVPGGNPSDPGDWVPNENYVPLGSDDASGFGWKDMNVIKFGVEYLGISDWIFRTGYSFGRQPIPESEVLFNIVAPGVVEHHLGLGLTRIAGKKNTEINLGFNYAFSNTVTGPNPMDFDPTEAAQGNMIPNQWIDLTMRQMEFEFGVTF